MAHDLEIGVVALYERGAHTVCLELNVAGLAVNLTLTPDQARSLAFDLNQRATDADEKAEELATRRAFVAAIQRAA